MAYILKNIFDGYRYVTEEITDPNTRGWFLTSPIFVVAIMTSYLFFCIKCGPKFMENRKPFQLKKVLIVYNAFQVMLSIYLTIGGYFAGWHKDYSFICEPVDYSDSPVAKRMNNMVYWYYIAKLTELLDTVFFVLRKKDNQVTFLHVYHHASMPVFAYFGLKYYPNGHGTGFGLLNSFVHIIMYTYYLIAGLGPQYQKYLWWKKHVTLIQLVQFILIFIHNFPPLFTSCRYPKVLNLMLCCDSTFFLYMFGKFYIKSYTKTSKTLSNGNAYGQLNGNVKNREE